VRLTRENTAVVLDSTSDFLDARERHANMRIVPLYVLFDGEAMRDHVDISPEGFYERLTAAKTLPTTSQLVGLVTADAAVGIFRGVPLPLTNIGGIDLLLSASYIPTFGSTTSSVRVEPERLVVVLDRTLGLALQDESPGERWEH